MFGNGLKNENIATASKGSIAITSMGDGNVVLQNPTYQTINQYLLPPDFFELCERGKKIDSKIDLQIDKVKEFINLGKLQSALAKIQEIEDIWNDDLKDHHKFRLATDYAIIYAIKNDYSNAVDKFLEAFALEKNEISYANRILAYTLIKDDKKLNQVIQEAQNAFPDSKAITSQVIKAYKYRYSIKDLNSISDDMFTDALCCLMASSFYMERNDFGNALIMARKANEIKTNDWQIMANLGNCLIYNIFSNKIYLSLLTEEQFSNLQQAEVLLEASWNIIKDREYPFDFISYIPMNLLLLYRFQQKREKANELLEILYDKLPNNSYIIFQKIINNINDVTCEEISKLQPQLCNDHAKLLADIYISKCDFNKALTVLKLAPDKNDIFIITTQVYCLKCIQKDKEIDKIKNQYKDKVIKSIIDFAKTNNPDVLLKIKDNIKRNDWKLHIAHFLYNCSKYREAIDLFQSAIIHKDLNDVFYRQYLECLAQTNQFFEIKKQLSNFTQEDMDDWCLCLLGCAHAGVYDFDEAKKLFNKLYETHKHDAMHICNFLIALTKLNNKSQVIEVLNAIDIDIYKLKGNLKYKYAIISYMNEYIDSEKSLKQIYLLTIHNMMEVEAWNQYFVFIAENHIERNGKEAYLLQDQASQSIRRIFIDDNIKLETKYFDVIKSEDPLAKNLLSHQQGDIISLNPSVKVIIKNVNDKYMCLAQIITENIFLEFPDNKELERVSASSPDELISYLKNISEIQKKQWNICQNIYDKGFPISLLAGMMKKDIFSVLETLQLSHIVIARGMLQEIDNTIKLCKGGDKYIIDAITLYNIFAFEMQNTLNPLKNKIYVTQSTKNKFVEIIEKIKTSTDFQASRLQTNAETGEMYMLSPEQLKCAASIELQYLEKILYWIENDSILVNAIYKTKFNDEQKKILSLFLEYDSEIPEIIDIAVEKNLVLISDDLYLREFAQTFDIHSIWTQVLLKLQQVSAAVYNDFLQKSILKHHTFISLTAQDLIYCLKNDNTPNLENFNLLVNKLGISSYDSAAKVIQEVLSYIQYKYLKYNKSHIYNMIINAYLQNGTSLDFDLRIKELHSIGNVFYSFRNSLSLWEKGHFVTS